MDNPPKKSNYILFGLIPFLVIIVIMFTFDILNVIKYNLSMGSIIESLGKTLFMTFFYCLSFFAPLIILIYFSKKYYFYREKRRLYLELPLISAISIIPMAAIISLIMGFTCEGESCWGIMAYQGAMAIYLVVLIIISLIIAYFLNKKIKQ